MVCSGSFEWWAVKQGLGIVALRKARDALVLVYEIVKDGGKHWQLAGWEVPVCFSHTLAKVHYCNLLWQRQAHKLFIWTRRKLSLMWLVHTKVCLVSQIGIKICRHMQQQSSFLGQCRFCNLSGSLVFKVLLINAEVTWLPYFVTFELELSTFFSDVMTQDLACLWRRAPRQSLSHLP